MVTDGSGENGLNIKKYQLTNDFGKLGNYQLCSCSILMTLIKEIADAGAKASAKNM